MAKWIFSEDGETAIHDITGDVYKLAPAKQKNATVQSKPDSSKQAPNLSIKEEEVKKEEVKANSVKDNSTESAQK
jgi:hypothetical protein